MHQFLQVLFFGLALGNSIIYIEYVVDNAIYKARPKRFAAVLFSVVVSLWTIFYLLNLEAVK